MRNNNNNNNNNNCGRHLGFLCLNGPRWPWRLLDTRMWLYHAILPHPRRWLRWANPIVSHQPRHWPGPLPDSGLGWATPDEGRLSDAPRSDATKTHDRPDDRHFRESYRRTPRSARLDSTIPLGRPDSYPPTSAPNSQMDDPTPAAPPVSHSTAPEHDACAAAEQLSNTLLSSRLGSSRTCRPLMRRHPTLH